MGFNDRTSFFFRKIWGSLYKFFDVDEADQGQENALEN
jgi:hypothetical protein